jgi:hypothetical protein
MPSLKAFWLDAQADGQKRQRGALKVTNFILHVDEPVISTKKERLIALFLNILFVHSNLYKSSSWVGQYAKYPSDTLDLSRSTTVLQRLH